MPTQNTLSHLAEKHAARFRPADQRAYATFKPVSTIPRIAPEIIAMTMRLFFLVILLACALLPTTGKAAVELRSIEVQILFDASAVSDKTLAGYKLYQNSLEVCTTSDPFATSIVCEFASEEGTYSYQLSAYYSDNTESPKSPPFQFTFGSSTPPVGDSAGAPPPPATTGDYLVSYSWDDTTDATRNGYRMYLNDTKICETADPQATTLSCYADLVNVAMIFSIASYDTSGTESLRSNFLTLDPADFPELFQKKTATFSWEYNDAESSAGGFQVFNNGTLLCSTNDPTAKTLQCTLDTLLLQHTFALAAVNAAGELTTFSNTIVYTGASGSTEQPPVTDQLTAAISASATTGTAPLAISFSATDSTGPIATYSWDFGDGDNGTGSTISHTYTVPGNYSATLSISDTSGKSALATVTVTANQAPVQLLPPTAVISSTAASGEAPLSVTFDGTGSTANNSTITSYNWDFGDGTRGTGQATSHTFAIAGTYSTQLLVTDSNGLTDTETTPVLVSPATAVNKEPTAAFTATPTQGSTPLTVLFDGGGSQDPDGSITTYTWNFGDGATGSGKTVQHTYTSAATYTATLQVTDDQDATSNSVAKTIIAEEAKQEIILNYEVGELALTSDWVKVNFANTFNSPVVFISPPTNNDKEAVTTRIRNLTKTGFEIRLQEWDYLNGTHQQETISFLVLEQGQTTLPGGGSIEVGSFNGSTRKQTVKFKNAFATAPLVITTIFTENEKDAVISRVYAVTATGFAYLMQEQELTKTKHVNESVAYLAWSPGSYEIDELVFDVVQTTAGVTDQVTTIPFSSPLKAAPFFFAEQQTMNSADTAALRLTSISETEAALYLQEDQSKDLETSHIAEDVGYLTLASSANSSSAKEMKVSFTWTFNSSLESLISGFRIYRNNEKVCETLSPSAREATCTLPLMTTNSFSIRAFDPSNVESQISNTIEYTP